MLGGRLHDQSGLRAEPGVVDGRAQQPARTQQIDDADLVHPQDGTEMLDHGVALVRGAVVECAAGGR
jgi:hypothetical protein